MQLVHQKCENSHNEIGRNSMKKSRYSDQQIAHAVKMAEAGVPVEEVMRQCGLSEAILYGWRRRI